MSSFSSAVLVGNLTADPELRYLSTGPAVASFSLGLNRKFTRKDGEKGEEVSFVDVTCWDRLAEVAAQFLKKGRKVLVSGYLKQDRWEDKETGQKRSKLCVVASQIQFLGGGSRDDEGDGEPITEAPTPGEEGRREASPARPGRKKEPIFRAPAGTHGSRSRK